MNFSQLFFANSNVFSVVPRLTLSLGIWPSGWMPCSRQKSSQQALPFFERDETCACDNFDSSGIALNHLQNLILICFGQRTLIFEGVTDLDTGLADVEAESFTLEVKK